MPEPIANTPDARAKWLLDIIQDPRQIPLRLATSPTENIVAFNPREIRDFLYPSPALSVDRIPNYSPVAWRRLRNEILQGCDLVMGGYLWQVPLDGLERVVGEGSSAYVYAGPAPRSRDDQERSDQRIFLATAADLIAALGHRLQKCDFRHCQAPLFIRRGKLRIIDDDPIRGQYCSKKCQNAENQRLDRLRDKESVWDRDKTQWDGGETHWDLQIEEARAIAQTEETSAAVAAALVAIGRR